MAEKALVLGGGGVTGVAWEIGILYGLAEQGVDLSDADLVVGTSAGSIVGVDLRSGKSLAEVYQAQTTPSVNDVYARMSLPLMLRYGRAVAFSRTPIGARTRIGALALRAKTEPEATRRKVFESRLPISEWPAGKLQITAVDAATGEFVVFDAASGVGLVDAVGASCAVPGIWPPVTIDGKRYVDGGMRSPANADLAASHQAAVVIAPLTQGFRNVPSLGSQIKMLTEQGTRVVAITPDAEARKAVGRNVLDPAHRPAAAMAGHAQAESVAAAVKEIWSPGPSGPP